jgi:hypothetical protein
MIDVNKITSTLAKLPDAQLQQYAQMHKADPYIMALAMSESNRRKEMRAAGQGAQGVQEQPKVVDQMVAGMAPQQLPEEQGIGQLPAGNMNFAGGGIIAFADGGDVERYQYGGMPKPTSMMGDIPGFVAGTGNIIPQQGAPEEEPILRRWYREMSEKNAAARAAEEKRRVAQGYAAPSDQMLADMSAAQSNPAQDMAQFDAASNLYMTERAAKQAAAAPQTSKAAPTADTGRKAPGAGLGAAAAANAAAKADTGPTDIDALQQKYFGQIDQEVGGLRNARAGLVAGIKDLTEQNLAATKADIEKRGDVYKGREERLAKQEKGLEGMGDKYMGLALLQAGAAMMSTPGGLGVALGKGIQVGSERYVAGLDKIEAAKSKFAEARDRLDDLRINRDDMNARDIRAAEKEVRESKLKGQELLYNGLVSDLGIKQKNVTAIFGAAADDLKTTRQIEAERQNTLTREGGANARNAATIAAHKDTPDRLVFDKLLADNKGDAVKAAEALQKMKAEKFNLYEAYSKYLTGFAGKETVTPPDSFDQFASRFAVPTTKTPGKGATVLQQP